MIGALENTKSEVREVSGTVLYSVDTPQILRCSQTNAMWLQMKKNGQLYVGKNPNFIL